MAPFTKVSAVFWSILLRKVQAFATSNASRSVHHPVDSKQTRLLQILPRTKSSYYVVDWKLSGGGDCASHLLSVDLECMNGNTEVVSASNATCAMLTGEDWVRCTATNQTSIASVHVKCEGDTIQALTLLAKSVPFSVQCFEISSPSIYMLINRRCPTNTRDDVAMNTENGYTLEKVTFFCLNASPLENGVCRSKGYVSCLVADNGNGPFLACDKFQRFSVLAGVYYSSIEDGTCLFDVEDDNNVGLLPATDTPTALRPPVNTTASTREGDLKEATYQIYFDTKKNATSTDCLFPAPSVLLVCGSGNVPTLKKVKSTSCYGIRTRDQVTMSRCFAVQAGFSGSVVAACSGTSEASREMFVYMEEQTLPQCENGTAGQVVANFIWIAALCENDVLRGEKSKCLQATKSQVSDSLDTCESSYACDETTCTGQELIMSANAVSDLCLVDVSEDSPSTNLGTELPTTQANISMDGESTTGANPLAKGATSGAYGEFVSTLATLVQFWLLGFTNEYLDLSSA